MFLLSSMVLLFTEERYVNIIMSKFIEMKKKDFGALTAKAEFSCQIQFICHLCANISRWHNMIIKIIDKKTIQEFKTIENKKIQS